MVTSALCGVMTLLTTGGCDRERDVVTSVAAEVDRNDARRSTENEWPTLPPGTPPARGTPPRFPDFARETAFEIPEERKREPDIMGWFLEETASRTLGYAVKNHPRIEISQRMHEDIQSGTLAVMLGIPGGGANMEAVFVDTGPDFGNRPVMFVNPEFVLYARDSPTPRREDAEIAEVMLVLFHEGVHYGQWRETLPSERTIFSPMQPSQLTPAICERKWRMEREAYRETCLLWYELGSTVSRMERLCAPVGSDLAFDQALFSWLIDSTDPTVDNGCTPVFARLAGHPNPERFSRP